MLEPEIELVVGSKLNFDKPFFQFNEKKIYGKSYFIGTFSVSLEILNTRHC